MSSSVGKQRHFALKEWETPSRSIKAQKLQYSFQVIEVPHHFDFLK